MAGPTARVRFSEGRLSSAGFARCGRRAPRRRNVYVDTTPSTSSVTARICLACSGAANLSSSRCTLASWRGAQAGLRAFISVYKGPLGRVDVLVGSGAWAGGRRGESGSLIWRGGHVGVAESGGRAIAQANPEGAVTELWGVLGDRPAAVGN